MEPIFVSLERRRQRAPDAVNWRSGDRHEGQTRMGDGKSVRTRSWSALQLLPQGEDGATLTVMPANDQSALPWLVFRSHKP